MRSTLGLDFSAKIHPCYEFFARSPQNLTVLAPFMVLKQSNFGENVQKTRSTGHN